MTECQINFENFQTDYVNRWNSIHFKYNSHSQWKAEVAGINYTKFTMTH